MKNRGFSLVELSIVLVILGLLTGGILTGQSLIRASELRSLATEFQRYQTAVNTFRDKYRALPGDMRNATDFWTEQAAGTACKTASSTTMATCDGDGDGQVFSVAANSDERFRFWQHLANAGLIEGTYTGVAGSGGVSHGVLGENVPRSRLGNAGWSAYYFGDVNSHPLAFDGAYGHILGAGAGVSNALPFNPIITPEEAWNIDTKMDDGRPALGNVFVAKSSSIFAPNCATLDTVDAVYTLTNTNTICNINWRNAF